MRRYTLFSTASALALVTSQLLVASAPQAAEFSERVVVAMDDMMSGGMNQNTNQPAQGSTMGSQGECMPQSPSNQMGGMGMMGGGMGMKGGAGMMGGRMCGTSQGQAQTMPGMSANGVDVTDHAEGRIAFLRAELQISDAQTAVWNQFVDALRSSRKHLLDARQALAATGNSTTRLEQYERHLAERLEALRASRASFTQLYTVLNEHQRHVSDELVVPFLETF